MSKKTSDKSIREQVFALYDGRCAYCGCEITMKTLQIDHIEPLRRKMPNCEHGKECITNYHPSCAPCNFSKSSMDLEVWRTQLSKKLDRIERDSSTYRLAKRFGMVIENRQPIVFHFETFYPF